MTLHSKRFASLAVCTLFGATVVLSALPGSASAEGRRDEHRDHGRRGPVFGGGYYAPPPVVYNNPYYYAAPPVVYGPGFGLSVNIR